MEFPRDEPSYLQLALKLDKEPVDELSDAQALSCATTDRDDRLLSRRPG